jgi:hypothetical protein
VIGAGTGNGSLQTTSCPRQALVVSMYPRVALPRSTDSEETVVNPPSTKEGIMEIALIPGIFVGIFALGAAMILWFPYDA